MAFIKYQWRIGHGFDFHRPTLGERSDQPHRLSLVKTESGGIRASHKVCSTMSVRKFPPEWAWELFPLITN